MNRIEKLSIEQLEVQDKLAESEGFAETQTLENIPVGVVSGNVNLITVNGKVSPNFNLVKFEREKEDKGVKSVIKLKFKAVSCNVTHMTSGKGYSDVLVKLSDELKVALMDQSNYTKSILFESVPYVDSQKRERTILRFDSISK